MVFIRTSSKIIGDNMELTPHQQEREDRVIWLVEKGKKRVVIIGSAGVGKTVLVGSLVKYFSNKFRYGCIYVTAPTNKALAVLKTKVEEGDNIIFKTIHSALRLKKYDDSKTGKRTFVKGYRNGIPKADDFEVSKICIIDESSMLNSEIEGNSKKGEERIEGYLKDYNGTIIYVGDDKQLNPVGEPFSPVFHKGYPTVELTEIVRQGEGNPIIDLSRDLDIIYFKKPRIFPISNGIKTVSNLNGYLYSNDIQAIIDNLAMVNGTDELKYLAYTNKEVDKMNEMVRARRYGTPRRLELEETIIFNSPFGDFYTNQEIKVEKLDIVEGNVNMPTFETRFDSGSNPINNKFDKLWMKLYVVNDSFGVVHEDSDKIFKEAVKDIKNKCIKIGWDWRGYYWFVEQFADIKYNHAITVHKSQGSTYKESILNIQDIGFCRDSVERQRLLYTAVTRASNLVILHKVR